MTEMNEVPDATQGPGQTNDPQPDSGGTPTAADPGDRETNKDARLWAMFCHLAGLAGLVLPAIGCVIGPLVVWLIKKEEFPFVDEQGKEALNFQLTLLIGWVIAFVLSCFCIGFILYPLLLLAAIIFSILGAVKANSGVAYRYPWSIKFIK